MSSFAIETKNLDFSFQKDDLTIRSLNIRVQKGTIYGFLGPNGSGKTTTIRLILGLLKPLNGKVMLFDNELNKSVPGIFSRIGTLVETPSLYDHLSAHDNLKLVQRVKKLSKSSIDESLALVGLSHVAKKPSGKFSLGMKQRLGLAIALMSNPDLLILDEPSNGLDPSGMLEIRELLLRLNKENGITIMISSHLLQEIEKLVTHMGIISEGSLVFEDTIGALQHLQQPLLQIKTNDNSKAIKLLKNHSANIKEEVIEVRVTDDLYVPGIARELIENGFDIFDLHVSRSSLENIFLSLTGTNNKIS